jgi:hypothetical protein
MFVLLVEIPDEHATGMQAVDASVKLPTSGEIYG